MPCLHVKMAFDDDFQAIQMLSDHSLSIIILLFPLVRHTLNLNDTIHFFMGCDMTHFYSAFFIAPYLFYSALFSGAMIATLGPSLTRLAD